jgi:hypothetical protein
LKSKKDLSIQTSLTIFFLFKTNSVLKNAYLQNVNYNKSLLEAAHQYKIRESRPSTIYTRVSTTIDDVNYLYYHHNSNVNDNKHVQYDLKSSEV